MAHLEGMASTGPINHAAKQLSMSYKSAWSKIRSTEARFGTKIVDTDNATSSRRTAADLALPERSRQLKQRCLKADDTFFISFWTPPTQLLGNKHCRWLGSGCVSDSLQL